MNHVFAIPTHATCLDAPIDCGTAKSITEAKRIVRAAGFRIMTVGGTIDQYDAEDGPKIYGYEPDGMAAISITVHPA